MAGRKRKKPEPVPEAPDALPEFLYVDEVRKIISGAESSTIVNSEDYIYFCIAPSFEEVRFHNLYRDKCIRVLMVLNFKDNPIGYLIYFETFPEHRKISDFGAAFFFSKARKKFNTYDNVDIPFADQKFRIISFDGKDYFAAVKWKSTNPIGEPVE
jgi:hypothetical protein